MSALQAKKVANRVQEQAAGAAGGAGDAGGAGELASLKKVTRGWKEVLDEPAPASGGAWGAEGRGAPAEALSEKEAKKLRKEVGLPPASAKWLQALLQSCCKRFCKVAASAFAGPASCCCDCCR